MNSKTNLTTKQTPMRTTKVLFSAIMFSALIWSASCSKTSEEPVEQKPALTLATETGYISANATVVAKSALKFGIRATANSTSNAPLSGFTLKRTMDGSTQTYDTTFSSATYNADLSTTANTKAGNESFSFTVRDKNGQSNTLNITITTTVPTFGIHQDGAESEFISFVPNK